MLNLSMSKKQISTLDPEVKEEYFQKGWNDPDNLKYLDAGEKNPATIVQKALQITSDLCIYTNDKITILEA